eukprot:COSAG04_NODE_10538_length_770_cov_1.031297_2_plen_44_part_01
MRKDAPSLSTGTRAVSAVRVFPTAQSTKWLSDRGESAEPLAGAR